MFWVEFSEDERELSFHIAYESFSELTDDMRISIAHEYHVHECAQQIVRFRKNLINKKDDELEIGYCTINTDFNKRTISLKFKQMQILFDMDYEIYIHDRRSYYEDLLRSMNYICEFINSSDKSSDLT